MVAQVRGAQVAGRPSSRETKSGSSKCKGAQVAGEPKSGGAQVEGDPKLKGVPI